MKLKNTAYYILSTCVIAAFSSLAQAQTSDSIATKSKQVVNKIGEKAIGYGNQQEDFVTGSISTVKGSDVRPAFNNKLGNTLLGRLPGLTVRQNGFEPGANSTTFDIRGVNTYGFSNAPLIIIDGFLGDYSQLLPEEIEEISILKDASATAVYGMRGANGVVLITTKQGVNKPLSVNFNAQYGIQSPTSTPKYLDSYNYATLYNEALRNEGRPELYTAQQLELYKNGSSPVFHPNINWYDEVFSDFAPQSNYNLNFKGGNNNVRYFAMLNALSSDGLYKKFGDADVESSNSKYKRLNFRTNVDVSLTKNLSARLNIGGSVEDKRNPGSINVGSTISLLDRLAPNSFPVVNPDGSFGGSNLFTNPIIDLFKTGFSTSNGTTLQSSLKFTQLLDMVTPGLKASAAVSFNSSYITNSNKTKTYQRFSAQDVGTGSPVYVGYGLLTSLSPTEGVQSQWRNNSIQGFLNYDRTFGKHGVSAMVMYNTDAFFVDRNYPGTNASAQDLAYKFNGVSSRFTYVNSKKYIAEFSGSYMATNAFDNAARGGFFPAASLGWIASKETFLKDNSVIDFFKVRASYGLVGNENIGGQRFGFSQRYPYGDSYIFAGTTNSSSLQEGRRANQQLSWEKEKKANVGLEVNFAKRFGIVFDAFVNDRYDILDQSDATLPLILGYNGFPEVNLGKVKNKGLEITLKYANKEGKKVQFFAELMAANAKNEITFSGEQFQINSNKYTTGLPVGYGFGYQALGFFTVAEVADPSVARPTGIVIRPGDIKFKDIGGPLGIPDGIIDDNDQTAIGNYGVPDWTFALHTGVNYKGFDLNLMFQGVTGVKTNISGNRYQAFQNNGQATEIALNRWTPETDAIATYPRLSTTGDLNNYRFSSFWQRNASYLKLRSLELGYSIPVSVLKNLNIKQSRVFVNGTNLLSIDHIPEGDVEALNGYSALRTVSLGVNVSF